MCYITGNRIDPAGTSDPNFAGYDDVDNGATTLTTPILDLSKLKSPTIRYWYYYSNDKGQNPGIPQWQTDISGDNGSTWKSLQLTNQSTDGWSQFAFHPFDHISPSSSVKIRFIASDNIGALVEAGVDDLEILDPIQAESGVFSPHHTQAQVPYPNPVHQGEKLHLPSNTISPPILTDLLGRIIATADIGTGSVTIPAAISPGIYFIEHAGQKYKIMIEP